MTKAELRELIKTGPGHTIELVPEGTRAKALAETLAAFANANGGTVVLGVDPKTRTAIGYANALEGARLLAEAARLVSPPLILPLPTEVSVGEGRTVLVVTVPEGLPHVYHMSGRYLQRRDALNRPLPADELKRLLIDRGDTTFDALPAHGAAQVDLDQAKLARYLALFKATSGENPQELLRSRGILTPDRHGRRLVPTHAGILLFGKDVTRFLPQAEMILVRYPGRQPGDQFLRQDIRTTLPEAVHEALMWLLSNMRKGARLSGLERQDVPEYPPEAVREALVNAVAHRDYTIRGEGVRVIMFSDRIEFYSPGRLPGHVTVDNIEDERFSRNPIVVQALADLGLIEKLGYGINRMIRLMGEWRLPAPVFKETAGGFLVTLMGQGEGMRAVPLARTMEMWLRQGLNERQIAALAYLSEHGTITNREYRELYPDVTDETVRRDLADLVDRDLIIKVGDKRATYYILK